MAYPDVPPRAFFWREAGQPWLEDVWRPFWHALDDAARQDYLSRYPPPKLWLETFLDDRLDQLVAEIDAQDEIGPPVPAPPRRGPLARLRRWLRGY